jgi:hypothetical protein
MMVVQKRLYEAAVIRVAESDEQCWFNNYHGLLYRHLDIIFGNSLGSEHGTANKGRAGEHGR